MSDSSPKGGAAPGPRPHPGHRAPRDEPIPPAAPRSRNTWSRPDNNRSRTPSDPDPRRAKGSADSITPSKRFFASFALIAAAGFARSTLAILAGRPGSAALAAGPAGAAYCGGSPDPNAQPNAYPVNRGTPALYAEGPNGRAYVAGQPGFEFWLLHVYGSAYDMG